MKTKTIPALKWLVCVCLILPGMVFAGELQPASLFQDHMVLQRDMPVPV